MSAARSEPSASPVSRLLFLLLSVGFVATTLTLVWPEVSQLVTSQRSAYHFGDPPRVLPLVAGLLPLLGTLVVLVRFLRKRPPPLWALGLVVAGSVAAMASMGLGEVPAGRTWAAADVRILSVTRDLQKRMLERLKVDGKLPTDEASWSKALSETTLEPSPARTRSFKPVPYRFMLQREQGRVPEGLAPGTVLAWVNPARDYFELTAVGFARDGAVGPLSDDKGERIVLRGGLAPEQAGTP